MQAHMYILYPHYINVCNVFYQESRCIHQSTQKGHRPDGYFPLKRSPCHMRHIGLQFFDLGFKSYSKLSCVLEVTVYLFKGQHVR